MPRRTWSLDETRLQEHLWNKDDPLQIVLRGHLYIDGAISALLEEHSPRPSAIEWTRLSFATRLDLGVALGLLSPSNKPAFVAANRLRNRMAHDLDAEVGPQDVDVLFRAMDPKLQYAATAPRGEKFPQSLASIFATLIVSVDRAIDRERERQRHMAQLMRSLRDMHERVEELRGRSDRRSGPSQATRTTS